VRIGIDAREICGRATGVGRYLAGLLREWAADDRARRHEFVLYAQEKDRLKGAPKALEDADAISSSFTTRVVDGTPGVWWEQMRLPRAARADRLDVFFAPAYSAPLRLDVPVVVAIHDLSFVAHPEWFRMREGIRRRWLARRAAARARAVITISEFSRRELLERFGLAAAKIHVIPPGIDRDRPGAPAGGDARVLYVGSIFNRRHVPDLIRAFGRVAASHADAALDIVGDNRTFPVQDLQRVIAAESLDGRVRWHSYVPEAELQELFRRARAFAFLSEYEGLGLTPLEALASGIPPVVLDTAVARESCGAAAVYVPASDIAATAAAIERVLFDAATRERILAAAPAVLAKYSWPKAARETLAVIEGAA
jgi:glycosyltransferase involved in cell wall biosynthesis